MGCEQSDVMPFIENLVGDDEPNNANQQRRPNNAAQSQQSSNPNIQQQAVNGKVGAVPSGPGRKKKKNAEPREILEPKVNFNDDFVTHHLKYELTLSKYSTKSKIKKRQILEHIILQNHWGNIGGKDINVIAYFESAQTAWMQRTFLDIWEIAHDQFFNQGVEEKAVRRKVAQQYMFEIYELKEYVDAGLGSISAFCPKSRCNLYEFMQCSDDGLFNIFKKLKERYPQTGNTQKIDFPDVPSTKTNLNLLNNFESKAYIDPPNINLQTIYDDINLLLKKAVQLQDVFKEDMKQILGSDALACPKVNQVIKDGVPEFNACAVRRVFIKWAQNLLELCPDLEMSKPFLMFIKAKADIINNFFFKSTIQKSTHKIVIDTICYLIEVAKYNVKDNTRRKEFLFNIYDLLRCKVKRSNPQQIVALLKKMEETKVTKNGQKFEVLRVKNRFKTNNRDLLINFRYGDILVGEAQLCIDDANVSKTTKHNYEFCHYIYELERSLFGPTLELMMQYEDFSRPDISVSFEAEDLVDERKDILVKLAEPTKRLCLQGHKMVGLIGNYFVGDDVNAAISASCNYCDRITDSSVRYDYCFQCNCFLCRGCLKEYATYDVKKTWMSIQREEVAGKIADQNQLVAECNKKKSLLVLFYQDGSSSSTIFKDSLIYHQCKLMMQPGKFIPNIAVANFSTPGVKALCNTYKITELPTLILFNQQAQPVRTLIGYSWLQVPFFYETQKRLLEGATIQIDLFCAGCRSEGEENGLTYKHLSQIGQNLICLNCFNNNQPINVPEEYKQVGGVCSKGHFRCVACSYAGMDIPSTYRDQTGVNYLSEPIMNPKIKKCPKGHTPAITKINTLGSWQYTCFGCQQKKFFDDQYGVAVCTQCKLGLCPSCMGYREPNLKQIQDGSDLAGHFVESTAEEGVLCICQKHFKKVYKSRNLSMEELINQHQTGSTDWECIICQKKKPEGSLHIACFKCPGFEEKNFEVCLNCAAKSQLLMRETEDKVKEENSYFVCPNRHQMVKTSMAYDQQLTFDCMYCRKKYFINTQRVHCKQCKYNCCNNCITMLGNANPPRCNQKCKSGHALGLVYKAKKLQFCNGCVKVIKTEHFSCTNGDDYQLCLQCAYKTTSFSDVFDDIMKAVGSEDEEQQQYDYNKQQQANSEGDFDLGINFGDFF